MKCFEDICYAETNDLIDSHGLTISQLYSMQARNIPTGSVGWDHLTIHYCEKQDYYAIVGFDDIDSKLADLMIQNAFEKAIEDLNWDPDDCNEDLTFSSYQEALQLLLLLLDEWDEW